MVSDEHIAEIREAARQSFQVLVEALMARGHTPRAARNFVRRHEHRISNLAVHGIEETSREDHA